jgi:predicted DNA-binding transcriptional regulator YafY
MRADRLLALLMLLQNRGKMTAQALADELEVSVRTIYRDVDALSTSGVPVYAERGPGGGVALLDSYRTTLTGLNEDEVQALFTLSIPAPLADLGMGRQLKAALLKLSAALPTSRREEGMKARQRIHLDWTGWFEAQASPPSLGALQRAVWDDAWVRITYRLRFRGENIERRVAPYGLVAKAGVWYLVAHREGHTHTYRVARILDVRAEEEHFARPPDFDLAAFWERACAQLEEHRARYPVTARVSPELAPWLPGILGEDLGDQIARARPDAEGWITLHLVFDSFEDARTRILGLGRAVEVLAPQALRYSVRDFAQQIVAFYAQA